MIKSAQPQIVKDYLDRLRVALVGLPDEVGHEILAGIAEELAGLDATEAAARIDALGDPTFIAAEARREVGVVAHPPGMSRLRQLHPVIRAGTSCWRVCSSPSVGL